MSFGPATGDRFRAGRTNWMATKATRSPAKIFFIIWRSRDLLAAFGAAGKRRVAPRRRRGSPRSRLRVQRLLLPLSAGANETDALMQAIGPLLPQLDHFRHHVKT